MLNWAVSRSAPRGFQSAMAAALLGLAGNCFPGSLLAQDEVAPRGVNRPAAETPSLSGGAGADFTQLIQLITTTTSGGWITDGLGEGSMSQYDSGVRVDTRGVLSTATQEEKTGRLTALGQRARVADLNADMAQPSQLRLVSLTRLEQEVAQRLQEGRPVAQSMLQMAGLTRIQYVFCYPESGEIVVGGPAEGWKYDADGRSVGAVSGQPTLQLDDFVTLWRSLDEGSQGVFRCSIDPRQENLKALREFAAASQQRGALRPAEVKNWAKQLGTVLGNQDISINGVPATSRVANVIVEADYRMKLIGIGKLEGGPSVPSYFELLAKHPELAGGSLDALRWWMTLNCEEVLYAPDRNAFEIRGTSVKCLSENELLSQSGERIATGKAEPINQLFAENFTSNFDDLARREPIFADLRNVFDLALVASLLHHERLDEIVNWDGGVFAPAGSYRPTAYPVPRECETVVNHRVYNGRDVVVQVAGGVRADVGAILRDGDLQQVQPRLAGVADNAAAPELPIGRWWWDAR